MAAIAGLLVAGLAAAEFDPIRFEANPRIIPLYLDSARTHLQLSIAPLGATAVFREKIIGSDAKPGHRMSTMLC